MKKKTLLILLTFLLMIFSILFIVALTESVEYFKVYKIFMRSYEMNEGAAGSHYYNSKGEEITSAEWLCLTKSELVIKPIFWIVGSLLLLAICLYMLIKVIKCGHLILRGEQKEQYLQQKRENKINRLHKKNK